MNKKSIQEIDVDGKKVLVRVDFNVPLDENGTITDDRRIREALPTIRYLREHNAKVILMSHLGRPKGKFNMKYSLKPVAERLSEKLGAEVRLAGDVIGDAVQAMTESLKEGDVMLLENVRFYEEEEKNDKGFSKKLASLGDIYVNDAFGTAHRAHATTAGIAEYLPSAVGFLIKKELDIMGKALTAPERPFVAILGGAKVSDKIGVIENMMDKVDTLLIGGGMAYTFFGAMGYEIGKSIFEADKAELAGELLKKAETKGVKLLLPVDTVVASEFSNDAPKKTVPVAMIPKDMMGMDIGEDTRKIFSEIVKNARTVIWNGPMGVFEMEKFAAGTSAVAKALAIATANGAFTLIGGGDSVAAINKNKLADKVSYVSTGGGAMLEYMEGKALPGIKAIRGN